MRTGAKGKIDPSRPSRPLASVGRTATHGRAQASALYLAAYYLGNSLGGTLGADAYHAGGWSGTVLVALAAMALAVAITLYGTVHARVAAARDGHPVLVTR